jgi:ppGpp synthetase/RelA/SpoT-type nucleotidyltranferase
MGAQERINQFGEILKNLVALRDHPPAGMNANDITNHEMAQVRGALMDLVGEIQAPGAKASVEMLLSRVIDHDDKNLLSKLNFQGLQDFSRAAPEAADSLKKAETARDPKEKESALFDSLQKFVALRDEGKVSEIVDAIRQNIPLFESPMDQLGTYTQMMTILKGSGFAKADEIQKDGKSLADGMVNDRSLNDVGWTRSALKAQQFYQVAGDEGSLARLTPQFKKTRDRLLNYLYFGDGKDQTSKPTNSKERIELASLAVSLDQALLPNYLSEVHATPEGQQPLDAGGLVYGTLNVLQKEITRAKDLSPDARAAYLTQVTQMTQNFEVLGHGPQPQISEQNLAKQKEGLLSQLDGLVQEAGETIAGLKDQSPAEQLRQAGQILSRLTEAYAPLTQGEKPGLSTEDLAKRLGSLREKIQPILSANVQSSLGEIHVSEKTREAIASDLQSHLNEVLDHALKSGDTSVLAKVNDQYLEAFAGKLQGAHQALDVANGAKGAEVLDKSLAAAQAFGELGLPDRVQEALSRVNQVAHNPGVPAELRAEILTMTSHIYRSAGMETESNGTLDSIIALDVEGAGSKVHESAELARGFKALGQGDLSAASKHFKGLPENETAQSLLEKLEGAQRLQAQGKAANLVGAMESLMLSYASVGIEDKDKMPEEEFASRSRFSSDQVKDFIASAKQLILSGQSRDLPSAIEYLKKSPKYAGFDEVFFSANSKLKLDRALQVGAFAMSETDQDRQLLGMAGQYLKEANYSAAMQLANRFISDEKLGDEARKFVSDVPDQIFYDSLVRELKNASVIFAENPKEAAIGLGTMVLGFGVGKIAAVGVKGAMAVRAAEAIEASLKVGVDAARVAREAQIIKFGVEAASMTAEAAAVAATNSVIQGIQQGKVPDLQHFGKEFGSMMMLFGMGRVAHGAVAKLGGGAVAQYFTGVGTFVASKYVDPMLGLKPPVDQPFWKVVVQSFVEDLSMKGGGFLAHRIPGVHALEGRAQQNLLHMELLPKVAEMGYMKNGELTPGGMYLYQGLMGRAARGGDLPNLSENWSRLDLLEAAQGLKGLKLTREAKEGLAMGYWLARSGKGKLAATDGRQIAQDIKSLRESIQGTLKEIFPGERKSPQEKIAYKNLQQSLVETAMLKGWGTEELSSLRKLGPEISRALEEGTGQMATQAGVAATGPEARRLQGMLFAQAVRTAETPQQLAAEIHSAADKAARNIAQAAEAESIHLVKKAEAEPIPLVKKKTTGAAEHGAKESIIELSSSHLEEVIDVTEHAALEEENENQREAARKKSTAAEKITQEVSDSQIEDFSGIHATTSLEVRAIFKSPKADHEVNIDDYIPFTSSSMPEKDTARALDYWFRPENPEAPKTPEARRQLLEDLQRGEKGGASGKIFLLVEGHVHLEEVSKIKERMSWANELFPELQSKIGRIPRYAQEATLWCATMRPGASRSEIQQELRSTVLEVDAFIGASKNLPKELLKDIATRCFRGEMRMYEAKELRTLYENAEVSAEALGMKDFSKKLFERAQQDADYKTHPCNSYEKVLNTVEPILRLLHPLMDEAAIGTKETILDEVFDGTLTLDRAYNQAIQYSLGSMLQNLSSADIQQRFPEILQGIYLGHASPTKMSNLNNLLNAQGSRSYLLEVLSAVAFDHKISGESLMTLNHELQGLDPESQGSLLIYFGLQAEKMAGRLDTRMSEEEKSLERNVVNGLLYETAELAKQLRSLNPEGRSLVIDRLTKGKVTLASAALEVDRVAEGQGILTASDVTPADPYSATVVEEFPAGATSSRDRATYRPPAAAEAVPEQVGKDRMPAIKVGVARFRPISEVETQANKIAMAAPTPDRIARYVDHLVNKRGYTPEAAQEAAKAWAQQVLVDARAHQAGRTHIYDTSLPVKPETAHLDKATVDHHGRFANEKNTTEQLIDRLDSALGVARQNDLALARAKKDAKAMAEARRGLLEAGVAKPSEAQVTEIAAALRELNLREVTTDNLADGGWSVWVAQNQARVLADPNLRALITEATHFEDFTAFGTEYNEQAPGVRLQAALFQKYGEILASHKIVGSDRFSPAQAPQVMAEALRVIDQMVDDPTQREAAAEDFFTQVEAARETAVAQGLLREISVHEGSTDLSFFDLSQLGDFTVFQQWLALPRVETRAGSPDTLQVSVAPMGTSKAGDGTQVPRTLQIASIPNGRKLPSGKGMLVALERINAAEKAKAESLGLEANFWFGKDNVILPNPAKGGTLLSATELRDILCDRNLKPGEEPLRLFEAPAEQAPPPEKITKLSESEIFLRLFDIDRRLTVMSMTARGEPAHETLQKEATSLLEKLDTRRLGEKGQDLEAISRRFLKIEREFNHLIHQSVEADVKALEPVLSDISPGRWNDFKSRLAGARQDESSSLKLEEDLRKFVTTAFEDQVRRELSLSPFEQLPNELADSIGNVVDTMMTQKLLNGELPVATIKDFLSEAIKMHQTITEDGRFTGPTAEMILPSNGHFLLGSKPTADSYLKMLTNNLRGVRKLFGDQAGSIYRRETSLVSEMKTPDGKPTGFYMAVERGHHEVDTGIRIAIFEGPPDPKKPYSCTARLGINFGEDGSLQIVNVQGPTPSLSLSEGGPKPETMKRFNEAMGRGNPFDMLVTTAVLLARNAGFTRVEGIRGDAQKPHMDQVRKEGAKGKQRSDIYDSTFRRLGFKAPQGDSDYWTLDAQTLKINRENEPVEARDTRTPRGELGRGDLGRLPTTGPNTPGEFVRQVLIRRNEANKWDEKRAAKWDRQTPRALGEQVVGFWKTFAAALHNLKSQPGLYANPETNLDNENPFRLSDLAAPRFTVPSEISHEIDHLAKSDSPFAEAAQTFKSKLESGKIRTAEDYQKVEAEYRGTIKEVGQRLVEENRVATDLVLHVLEELYQDPTLNILEIHHRMKDAKDIGPKLVRRGWSNMNPMTDIGGVRVVFNDLFTEGPNGVEEFSTTAFLHSLKSAMAEHGIKIRGAVDEDGEPILDRDGKLMKDWDKIGRLIAGHPKRGYRAIHLVVEANGHPVEIQLKTAAMNEWGEIQHDVYKHKGNMSPELFSNVEAYFKEVSDYLSDREQGAAMPAEGMPRPPEVPEDVDLQLKIKLTTDFERVADLMERYTPEEARAAALPSARPTPRQAQFPAPPSERPESIPIPRDTPNIDRGDYNFEAQKALFFRGENAVNIKGALKPYFEGITQYLQSQKDPALQAAILGIEADINTLRREGMGEQTYDPVIDRLKRVATAFENIQQAQAKRMDLTSIFIPHIVSEYSQNRAEISQETKRPPEPSAGDTLRPGAVAGKTIRPGRREARTIRPERPTVLPSPEASQGFEETPELQVSELGEENPYAQAAQKKGSFQEGIQENSQEKPTWRPPKGLAGPAAILLAGIGSLFSEVAKAAPLQEAAPLHQHVDSVSEAYKTAGIAGAVVAGLALAVGVPLYRRYVASRESPIIPFSRENPIRVTEGASDFTIQPFVKQDMKSNRVIDGIPAKVSLDGTEVIGDVVRVGFVGQGFDLRDPNNPKRVEVTPMEALGMSREEAQRLGIKFDKNGDILEVPSGEFLIEVNVRGNQEELGIPISEAARKTQEPVWTELKQGHGTTRMRPFDIRLDVAQATAAESSPLRSYGRVSGIEVDENRPGQLGVRLEIYDPSDPAANPTNLMLGVSSSRERPMPEVVENRVIWMSGADATTLDIQSREIVGEKLFVLEDQPSEVTAKKALAVMTSESGGYLISSPKNFGRQVVVEGTFASVDSVSFEADKVHVWFKTLDLPGKKGERLSVDSVTLSLAEARQLGILPGHGGKARIQRNEFFLQDFTQKANGQLIIEGKAIRGTVAGMDVRIEEGKDGKMQMGLDHVPLVLDLSDLKDNQSPPSSQRRTGTGIAGLIGGSMGLLTLLAPDAAHAAPLHQHIDSVSEAYQNAGVIGAVVAGIALGLGIPLYRRYVTSRESPIIPDNRENPIRVTENVRDNQEGPGIPISEAARKTHEPVWTPKELSDMQKLGERAGAGDVDARNTLQKLVYDKIPEAIEYLTQQARGKEAWAIRNLDHAAVVNAELIPVYQEILRDYSFEVRDADQTKNLGYLMYERFAPESAQGRPHFEVINWDPEGRKLWVRSPKGGGIHPLEGVGLDIGREPVFRPGDRLVLMSNIEGASGEIAVAGERRVPRTIQGNYYEATREVRNDGSVWITSQAKKKGHALGVEGDLAQVVKNNPELAKKLDITVNLDGSVTYPDIHGLNQRLEAHGFQFRFWEPRADEMKGGEREAESGQADYLQTIEHLAKVPPEFPLSGWGSEHFHDLGVHLLGYLALPPEALTQISKTAQILLEWTRYPEFQEEGPAREVLFRAIETFIDGGVDLHSGLFGDGVGKIRQSPSGAQDFDAMLTPLRMLTDRCNPSRIFSELSAWLQTEHELDQEYGESHPSLKSAMDRVEQLLDAPPPYSLKYLSPENLPTLLNQLESRIGRLSSGEPAQSSRADKHGEGQAAKIYGDLAKRAAAGDTARGAALMQTLNGDKEMAGAAAQALVDAGLQNPKLWKQLKSQIDSRSAIAVNAIRSVDVSRVKGAVQRGDPNASGLLNDLAKLRHPNAKAPNAKPKTDRVVFSQWNDTQPQSPSAESVPSSLGVRESTQKTTEAARIPSEVSSRGAAYVVGAPVAVFTAMAASGVDPRIAFLAAGVSALFTPGVLGGIFNWGKWGKTSSSSPLEFPPGVNRVQIARGPRGKFVVNDSKYAGIDCTIERGNDGRWYLTNGSTNHSPQTPANFAVDARASREKISISQDGKNFQEVPKFQWVPIEEGTTVRVGTKVFTFKPPAEITAPALAGTVETEVGGNRYSISKLEMDKVNDGRSSYGKIISANRDANNPALIQFQLSTIQNIFNPQAQRGSMALSLTPEQAASLGIPLTPEGTLDSSRYSPTLVLKNHKAEAQARQKVSARTQLQGSPGVEENNLFDSVPRKAAAQPIEPSMEPFLISSLQTPSLKLPAVPVMMAPPKIIAREGNPAGIFVGGNWMEGQSRLVPRDGKVVRAQEGLELRYNPQKSRYEYRKTKEASPEWRELKNGQKLQFEKDDFSFAELKGVAKTSGLDATMDLVYQATYQLATEGVKNHLLDLRKQGRSISDVDARNLSQFFSQNFNEAMLSYDSGQAIRERGGIAGGYSVTYALVDPQTGEIHRFATRNPKKEEQRKSPLWSIEKDVRNGKLVWIDSSKHFSPEPVKMEGIPPGAVAVPITLERMTGRMTVNKESLKNLRLSPNARDKIENIDGLVAQLGTAAMASLIRYVEGEGG